MFGSQGVRHLSQCCTELPFCQVPSQKKFRKEAPFARSFPAEVRNGTGFPQINGRRGEFKHRREWTVPRQLRRPFPATVRRAMKRLGYRALAPSLRSIALKRGHPATGPNMELRVGVQGTAPSNPASGGTLDSEEERGKPSQRNHSRNRAGAPRDARGRPAPRRPPKTSWA